VEIDACQGPRKVNADDALKAKIAVAV